MIFAAAAVIMAAAASSLAYVNSEKSSMDDLFNANVEVLANTEAGGVNCFCKVRWFEPNVCSVQGDGGYCGGDPCSDHDGNCRFNIF